MAEIDWPRFADDLKVSWAASGRTLDAIVADHPDLSRATISRASRADHETHSGNFLGLCRAFGLNPLDYYLATPAARTTMRGIRKRMENQHVSRGVKRETQEAAQ